MKFRRAISAVICGASLGTALFSEPALANSSEGHVTLEGTVACVLPATLNPQGWYATRVRFQAPNGEAHDAQISFRIFYSVDFNSVPAAGEVVSAYVTCSSGNSWGRTVPLTGADRQQFNLLVPTS
jgi:hypothetical protein